MTIRYGWIGKGIAVALGAVALALALPPETNGEPFPFPARMLASTLLLAERSLRSTRSWGTPSVGLSRGPFRRTPASPVRLRN